MSEDDLEDQRVMFYEEEMSPIELLMQKTDKSCVISYKHALIHWKQMNQKEVLSTL